MSCGYGNRPEALRGLLALHVLALLVLAFLSPGCASVLPRYDVRTFWLHKDVVVVTVYVHRKLDVGGYLSIVDREMEQLLSSPSPSEIPIYEVNFEFFLPEEASPARRKVAQIAFHAERGVSTPFTGPPRINLY